MDATNRNVFALDSKQRLLPREISFQQHGNAVLFAAHGGVLHVQQVFGDVRLALRAQELGHRYAVRRNMHGAVLVDFDRRRCRGTLCQACVRHADAKSGER
jgi:hypothetical protein